MTQDLFAILHYAQKQTEYHFTICVGHTQHRVDQKIVIEFSSHWPVFSSLARWLLATICGASILPHFAFYFLFCHTVLVRFRSCVPRELLLFVLRLSFCGNFSSSSVADLNSLKTPILQLKVVQGKVINVGTTDSSSAVLVMISSKSVSICNRSHARRANSGKLKLRLLTESSTCTRGGFRWDRSEYS